MQWHLRLKITELEDKQLFKLHKFFRETYTHWPQRAVVVLKWWSPTLLMILVQSQQLFHQKCFKITNISKTRGRGSPILKTLTSSRRRWVDEVRRHWLKSFYVVRKVSLEGGRYFSVDYVTLKVCKNGLLCKLLVSLPNCDEFTGTSTNAPRTYIKGIYFGFQSV